MKKSPTPTTVSAKRIPYCHRISTHGLTEFENFIKENHPQLYWKNWFTRLVKAGIDDVQKLEELEISRRLRINGIGPKYLPVLKEIQKLNPNTTPPKHPTTILCLRALCIARWRKSTNRQKPITSNIFRIKTIQNYDERKIFRTLWQH